MIWLFSVVARKQLNVYIANVTKFIEKKLFLKVNTDKTKILQASEKCQFLGFGFTQKVAKWKKKLYPTQKFFAVVHEKKQSKLIKVLRVITDRRAKGGIENVKRTLKLKLQGL